MPVNLTIPDEIASVAGVELAAVAAGIKNNGKLDLVLVTLPAGSATAAVFTRNAFYAAPVSVCRQHMQESAGRIRALLINSGGANAATGEQGLSNARQSCQWLAEQLKLPLESVLPFSTGVIGEQLPMGKIQSGLQTLCAGLSSDHWIAAANGIMTTDICPKLVSRTLKLPQGQITLSGFAKGSGMIQPNMATMLAYLFTDAAVPPDVLHTCLSQATERSFNSITVDGDTSTNDSYILSATGGSGIKLTPEDAQWTEFSQAVCELSLQLAQAVVRDGEGASKFISIHVSGAASEDDARQVGLTVGNSPLVKTAFFASDANLGRIIMAVGRSGVDGLQLDKFSLRLGDVAVLEKGQPVAEYTEEQGAKVMAGNEIDVHIELGCGSASWSVFACDFSHDYVSINADYRS